MKRRPLWMPPPPLPRRVCVASGWALLWIALGWLLTVLLWWAGA